MSAKNTYREWAAFEALVEPLRQDHERVRLDSDLTPEARTRSLWELEQKFSELHNAAIVSARKMGPPIEEAAIAALPQAQEAAMAARKPKDAVEMRELATGASAADLRRFVADVVQRRGLSLAHGLRQAITKCDRLEPAQVAELLAQLDSVSQGPRDDARAALVAHRVALNGLSRSNIEGSPLAVDPAEIITDRRQAGLVPADQNRGTVQLDEPEIRRLLEISGMPRRPPRVSR